MDEPEKQKKDARAIGDASRSEQNLPGRDPSGQDGEEKSSFYRDVVQIPLSCVTDGVSNVTGLPNPVMLKDSIDEIEEGLADDKPLAKRVRTAIGAVLLAIGELTRWLRYATSARRHCPRFQLG